jgi:glyoxylase-like metal-dependent hydrolase (beta-lactamase superfamily II)
MELTPNLHAFLWTSTSANNCNTYLIRSGDKNILIDPGHASLFDHVQSGLAALGLSPGDIDLILCTHAHPDHIESVRLFHGKPALFALHTAEWQLAEELAPMLKASMGIDLKEYSPDFFLTEGDLTVGDISLQVYHTPGHAPGSVTFFWPAEKALFTGDLIFKAGLGRTDVPGGSGRQLKESIRRIAAIDTEWLLPGHGDVVSGAAAVRGNFEQVERVWFGYV